MYKHYDLVYQCGIANVFRVTKEQSEGASWQYQRIAQGTFFSCEWFVRGLLEAGMEVSVWHSDVAGDVLLSHATPWHKGEGDMFGESKNPPEQCVAEHRGEGQGTVQRMEEMSDSYQAIYDAVRSRISNGDIGDAVSRAASSAFDISHVTPLAQQAIGILQNEWQTSAEEARRPSVLFRPAVFLDGNMYCALYGENLMEGVAGFGDTPDKACRAFDLAWTTAGKPTTAKKRHYYVPCGGDFCKECNEYFTHEIHLRVGEKP